MDIQRIKFRDTSEVINHNVSLKYLPMMFQKGMYISLKLLKIDKENNLPTQTSSLLVTYESKLI